ncbi:tRNA (cytidine(34)-2'-O)-methyltransferase [bacterium]|jgi:tRNA (cytidine/uridine-2'-O-)-methyltransferase|nr:tRNA (cytidine(34)-2'-O)-methyltransferase [bacterium]
MLTIVLVDPKIPPNTGNVARLCAATNTRLHLVGELGFTLDDKHLKRAGLDYWPYVNWEVFPDTESYFASLDPKSLALFTTKSEIAYTQVNYTPNHSLVFGSETLGLSETLRQQYSDQCVTLPMINPNIRSLNLATTVGIGLYEAIRQIA